MAKKIPASAVVAILAIIVVSVIIVLNAPLILHWILPGPGEIKTNSNLYGYDVIDSPEPHFTTQHIGGGDFAFSFNTEPSDDCLLVALVDYRTVPFYFDGDCNTTHYLGNGSGLPGKYSGVIRVTNLSEGYHDIILLSFVAPGNFSYDSWGLNTDMMATSSLRFNVIVNNSSVRPLPAFESRKTARNAVYRDGDVLQNPLAREPFDTLRWDRQTVKPGQVVDYYLRIRPSQLDGKALNSTFAVVQLLDYTQVPVRHNSTDLTYYGSVGANETCSVHLSVKAPDSPGPHRLAVVTTIGPYEDVQTAPSVYNRNISVVGAIEYVDLFVTE